MYHTIQTVKQRWSLKQIKDRIRDLKTCYDNQENRNLVKSFETSLETMITRGTKSITRSFNIVSWDVETGGL